MKRNHNVPVKRFLCLSIAIAMSATTQSHASGFQLFEANAINVANFGAGAAAEANDASIAFFNPAGLLRIPKQQLVTSGTAVHFSTHFSGSSSMTNTAAVFGGATYNQSGKASGGGWSLVPAFNYAAPLDDRMVFGLSVTAPFGLETDWADNSVVRYAATDTKLITIDISPNLAIKANRYFSFGAGFDAQYLHVDFNSIGGVPTDPINSDSRGLNAGKSWGYGWHGGMLFTLDEQTRFGIAYRSSVFHRIHGRSRFTGPLANTFNGGDIISNNLMGTTEVPATTTISAYRDVTSKIAILASAIYTQWDVFKNTTLQNVAAVDSNASAATTTLVVVTPQNFHNTWRFAVGANYKITDQWMARLGTGYDETPVNSTDRNIRLPDGDRYALSVGAQYRYSDRYSFEMGYTHLFIKDPLIKNTSTAGQQQTTINGTVHNDADLIAAQAVVNF